MNEDGSVFLQNSKARELWELLKLLEYNSDDYELNFESKSYIVKSSSYKDKIMLSATDITEQKRKENLVTMGQMAAHLSHEIRNPIGSISLLSSTLRKRVIPENMAIVDEIQKSVSRIDRIIKATLMFSKGVDANKSKITWSELRESIDMSIGYYAYSKDITFVFPQEDFSMYADKDLLDMLFSNFIINSIDAIELDEEEEGTIEIRYEVDDIFHYFYIYDTGVAIENKEELFEAFKSTKVKGNGLGLILSRQIAQAHGGEVALLDANKKCFEIKIAI